ncbi:PREDICTED: uncharacterized protein K02A2.6-like [Priapulus caudatus]|uniref:Uncharacterized protein K02A2.6-like n=1 Tax=Priapulus caudatus TaxID=37621 RepID=A0ABM1DYU8_PRICU|nr:PREDICTED: uncharacterized protein K02A2.6-like [Priapulus caudatus]
MAAIQLQPPPYEPFDCRSEGKNVRWTKWLRRLECNVFNGCGIVNALQKKGLLLMYGGSNLNDIVDSFDQQLLEPIPEIPGSENQTAVPGKQARVPGLTSHYVTRQKTCQFAEPNAEVKSQIIMGCRLDKVRDKGLSDPDVTLDKLLQYARNLEVTHAHSKAIKSQGLADITSTQASLVNAIGRRNAEQLVSEYSDLFTVLGKLKDYNVHLHIDETVQPVAQTHRRFPFHVRKDLEAQLQADEDLGVLQRPTGPTPWVSPVVCVTKKNGKLRVCIDMRCANMAIKRERHSTPTINELVNDLNGATVFSKLDLNQGYNQLELDEASRYITKFATHVGLRQFTRLNFGICSAAEVFQEAIRQALAGLKGGINLSDNMLVFGTDQTAHDENLRAAFQRLREKGLTLSKKKCEFNKPFEFFGHIFSNAGLAADPSKIQAILEI